MSLIPKLIPDDVQQTIDRFEGKVDRLIVLLERLVDQQERDAYHAGVQHQERYEGGFGG